MNRIKHACAVLLFALGALPPLAQAANVVTYDFSQTLQSFGGSIKGTLSLDLDAVANPNNITLAELNAHATYDLSVDNGTSTQFSDFQRTNANSVIELANAATQAVVISATGAALKFSRRPGSCLLAAPDAITEAECDAAGGFWDPTPTDFNLVFARQNPPTPRPYDNVDYLIITNPTPRVQISDGKGANAGGTNLVGQTEFSFPTYNPCGPGLAYTTNQWLMVGLPCQPTSNTVAGAFGNSPTANFVAGAYDVPTTGWAMYQRTVTTTPSQYTKLTSGDAFSAGVGLWLKSGTAPVGNQVTVTSGTPWPVTSPTGCQSANGCVVHPIETVSGGNRYNLVGNPLPYPVDWSKVRVKVGATVYTPTQAEAANIIQKQIWIWNGTNYDTCADDAPPCNLKYFQSFWVNVLPGAAGQTVELLIPAEASTVSQAAPASLPWYLGWLDWVAPPARAADSEWQVRLGVENRVTGWKDATNLVGQKLTAQTGYDRHDLIGMAPFAAPYLSLVFPHGDWSTLNGQKRAGDYDTDFRPAQGNPATTWSFELRASPTGGKVFITWQGDPAILKRSRLVDLQTGRTIDPTAKAYAQGYPVTLKSSVQRYRLRYLGP